MSRFWISWYENSPDGFEYNGPWWVTGERTSDGAATIVAAVIASDKDDARRIIVNAHDAPDGMHGQWRFCEERPADWSPFCDRFPLADWMQWPPAEAAG